MMSVPPWRLLASPIDETVTSIRFPLYDGDIETLGRLLHRSWLWKRELATNISNEEIDTIYAHALSHGAIGGKLLGAGGGGFLLLICEKDKQARLRLATHMRRSL